MTDDATRLRDQLEAVTGERVSALEGIGEVVAGNAPARGAEATGTQAGWQPDQGTGAVWDRMDLAAKDRELDTPIHEKRAEVDFDL